jgi:feruloyl esterase
MISKQKGAAVVAAQLAQCDALDGAKDGLISDPRACRFEARSLACKPGQDSATCLTPEEVRTIETYRSPLKIKGRAVGSAWGLADPSDLATTTFPAAGHIALLRGPGKPNDPVGFDVQAEYPHLRDYLEGVWRMTGSIDAVTRYLGKGKKLIIHHGWDDPMVPPDNSIHAFEALSARAGKDAANMRLYMQPGVAHCGGGTGPDQGELLAALSTWVEAGKAPGDLQTWKKASPADIRPLCAYPAAMHTVGGVNRCVRPKR